MPEQKPLKVLISGFEAFGGDEINPTHRLVDAVVAGEIALPVGIDVTAILLPVGFARAYEVLGEAIERVQPDVVLSLGQAGGRDSVEIERIAVNLMDAEIPDNDGFQPRDQHIAPGEMAAYFTTLPSREIFEALGEENIPARLSNSAGLYVCNYLFYRLQREGGVERSGFIHFPYLPEQTTTKPTMPFALMKFALEIILRTLVRSQTKES